MSLNQIGFVIVTVLIALTSAKSIEKEDVVFFPNPNGDGSLIPAQLTPTAGARAGNPEDVHFLLFTKENSDTYDGISVDDPESIEDSHFIIGAPTKLLVHGFGAHYYHTFPSDLRAVYTSAAFPENYNVILLDWSVLSDSPDYFTAVANAQVASDEAVKLLNFLVTSEKASWDNIELIGYSLGGQVVGQIGWKVQQLEGSPKIKRITSLDPANPLFDVASPENRTSPDDAEFVQVIHTACNGILGMFDVMGHVDFYPNGGRFQPGCGIDPTGACAHGRAPAMFTESVLVSPAKFIGKECADYEKYQSGECDNAPTEEMGHHTPANARGVYFLYSNDKAPFAQG